LLVEYKEVKYGTILFDNITCIQSWINSGTNLNKILFNINLYKVIYRLIYINKKYIILY